MLNMIYDIYKIKIDNFKVFILLSFFWISINTGSKYFILDYNDNFNISNLTNLIRSLLPYLAIVYFIINRDKYFKNFFLNFDLVFLFFLIYGLSQFSGLIYSLKNFHEHYWIVCLFAIIFFFKNKVDEKDSSSVKLIFFINKFYILILFSFFIFYTFKENILSENLLYHSQAFHYEFSGNPFPRASGLSRMCLILIIFFNSIYLSQKLSKRYNFYILIISSFLVFVLFTLQSRGAIIFFIFLFMLINILSKFKNFKKRILYFLFIIIIPILLTLSYPYFKISLIEKKEEVGQLSESQRKQNTDIKIFRDDIITEIKKNKNFKLSDKIAAISSNRVNAWKYLLDVFFYGKLSDTTKENLLSRNFSSESNPVINKKNFLTGYGPQADRHLMHNRSNPYLSPVIMGPFGAHASNVFIYSLICSGILGLISIIIINLLIVYKILIIFKNRKKISLQSDFILNSSMLITLFLQFRGLIENSYGVFGVDLILLISSYTVIVNAYKKISE